MLPTARKGESRMTRETMIILLDSLEERYTFDEEPDLPMEGEEDQVDIQLYCFRDIIVGVDEEELLLKVTGGGVCTLRETLDGFGIVYNMDDNERSLRSMFVDHLLILRNAAGGQTTGKTRFYDNGDDDSDSD